MINPWLYDRHADFLDRIQNLICRISTQCINHHLRILLCIHLHAFSILEIKDMDRIPVNHHAVCSSESFRDPCSQIQLLLNRNIRRRFQIECCPFYVIQIFIRVPIHLILPEIFFLQFIQPCSVLPFSEVRCIEVMSDLYFCQLMG